jgi:TM2 domain-containing membrane protein YozV
MGENAYSIEGIADVLAESRRRRAADRGRVARAATSTTIGRWQRLCACVSAIVPGGGQMLRREFAIGLCFVALVGLAAALAWAVIDTTPRLVANLGYLGIPDRAPAWALAALLGFAAMVHTVNAIHATGPGGPVAWHPLVPAIASAILPGAGQMLNGHRVRAGLFLTGLWSLGGIWLVTSTAAAGWLASIGARLPETASRLGSPSVLYTATGILWALAVYDAAAAARR